MRSVDPRAPVWGPDSLVLGFFASELNQLVVVPEAFALEGFSAMYLKRFAYR